MFGMKLKAECGPVAPSQWAEIMDIERRCEAGLDLEMVKSLHRKRKIEVVVAEFEDGVVGWMMWRREEGCLRLIRVVVHPNFRRRGIGTELVDALKKRLTRRTDAIKARVMEYNDEAVKFLASEAVGFRGVGVDGASTEYDNADDWAFEYKANK